jgi:hypothetical protein
MKYHFHPLTRARSATSLYDGVNVRKDFMRLSRSFAERLHGVERAHLCYDHRAKVLCLTPSKNNRGPLKDDAIRIVRSPRSKARIFCSTLGKVMPTGRYRFLRHTSEGYLCVYDPVKT